MRLLAFRVRNFRSVDDTGWIDVEQVTALIGTNEAGKTNVLTPLWKLNPAVGGAINALADYPRKRYSAIRDQTPKPIFIDARFELPPPLAEEAGALLRVSTDLLKAATVSRDFDGLYYVRFHLLDGPPVVERISVLRELELTLEDLVMTSFRKQDEVLKQTLMDAVRRAIEMVSANPAAELEGQPLLDLENHLTSVDVSKADVTSLLTGRFERVLKIVTDLPKAVTPENRQAARALVIKHAPPFVYYSDFGNLDSEIYLPHVIDNLQRRDLGTKEAAKARTLQVLFDFVKLSPQEILSLGQDPGDIHPVDEARAAGIAEKKKEREVLLQTAAADLTRGFRDWWKQGDYTLRFQADGDHFRIWVSDSRRPEPIELESRSSGLQWFLSFYLVFVAESARSHRGAILLLDEPGLSLHPLAQHDLSSFFDGLARTNQIVYTTHSPFMIDTDHLDRARSVFADRNGVTQVEDLGAARDRSDKAKSVFAAYAAVAMASAIAELPGSQPVIVEGESDASFLSGMRDYLVRAGHFRPARHILFMPAFTVGGAKALVDLIRAGDEPLPFVLLDSDAAGRQFAFGLKQDVYRLEPERILAVSDFKKIVDGELEDLIPTALLAPIVDRFLRKPAGVAIEFVDVAKENTAFVPQVEAYARKHDIPLDAHWKADFARLARRTILNAKGDVLRDAPGFVELWKKVFDAIHPPVAAGPAATAPSSSDEVPSGRPAGRPASKPKRPAKRR